MIKDIWKENRIRIGFSYFLLILEFSLFAMLPYFLGRSVDSIVRNDYTDFWIYLGACLFSLVAGFIRRRFDSRSFLRIWAGKATQTITKLMVTGMDSTKIVSRSYMVREFAFFFENTLPAVMQAFIEISIALTMLWVFTPSVGFICLILVLFAALISYLYAVKLMMIEAVCQQQREVINQNIIDGSKEGVVDGYEGQRKNYVQFADWEGFSWASVDILGVIAVVIVLLSIASAHLSPGIIMSNLAYCQKLFDKVMVVAGFFKHYRHLKLCKDFLTVPDEGSQVS
jgi:hypothetical protein